MPAVALRRVEDTDLEAFFAHQADPASVAMAASPARDREQFDAHWARLRADPDLVTRTVLADGEVAGNIGSWHAEDLQLVGYVLGRAYWGRGIATRALALFLDEVPQRPLHAYVAAHNTGSIRVLEKCGFRRETAVATHDPEDGVEEHRYVLLV